MKDEMRITVYSNSTEAKIKNSRIMLGKLNNDRCMVQIKTLSDDHRPRAVHEVIKGKIVSTTIALSSDAMIALYRALHYQLAKEYYINSILQPE